MGRGSPLSGCRASATRSGGRAGVSTGASACASSCDRSVSVCRAWAALTDAQVLDLFNEMLEAQAEIGAGVDPTLTEIPPGLPQIEYSERSDQWVPRGHVLRCHIEDDEEGRPIIHVDDVELDLEAFGRMLLTFCGFGMRIAFVDEEEVNEEPEIVVREPVDKESR